MIENGEQTSSSLDPGLAALVMLLRFQGVGVDPAQISHQFGARPIGVAEMLRCAKGFKLKANCLKTTWERLAKTPLPGIAVLRDGSFLLLGKADEHKPDGTKAFISSISSLRATPRGDHADRLRIRWKVQKLGSHSRPRMRSVAETVRRPGAKMAPASRTRTFDQVGRLNRSANPTSRDRNRSGSGDPDEPGRP